MKNSKKFNMKFIFFSLLIFGFFTFFSFSQTTGEGLKLSPRFEVVTGGTPITSLQTTSYGFAFIL